MKYVYPDVGNDPELFITEKGKLVPSEKLMGGQRKEPPIFAASGRNYLYDRDNKVYKVKVDNAAIELNFPPDTCLQVGLGNISRSLWRLKEEYMIPRVHQVSLKAAMEISEEDMTTCRSLLQFGCDPSLLFYNENLKVSRPICDPRTVRYRSTGYHVHLGLGKPSEYNYPSSGDMLTASKLLHTTEGRVRIVQMCDMIAGLPAVLLERDDEAVNIRRNILGYGRAGEFREQPHGFEYRTLGPWPLIHPAWAWWANGAVRDALQLVLAGADLEIVKKVPGVQVSDAINSSDKKAALKLWVTIKRAIADLVKNGRTENGKHPILGLRNLKLFEFAVATGGLSNTSFTFNSWLRGNKWGVKAGFPNIMARRFQSYAHLPKFMAFCKKWDLTRDNLSEYV